MDWDENVYVEIEKLVGESEVATETTKKNALLIMNGGADILNMDTEEFLEAVDFIEERAIRLDEQEEIIEDGGVALRWKSIVE